MIFIYLFGVTDSVVKTRVKTLDLQLMQIWNQSEFFAQF